MTFSWPILDTITAHIRRVDKNHDNTILVATDSGGSQMN